MNDLQISPEHENQRLDKFLFKYFNKAGKGFVYKMIRKKRIKLNNGKAEGSEILKSGDMIKFYLSPETMDSLMEERKLKSHNCAVDIIFEDENILVCNKPVGLLSHSENTYGDDTMIDRILAYLHSNGQFNTAKGTAFVPALCNRLDRNTSGIILCGKNLAAVQELNRIFAERRADKFYSAIVVGEVKDGAALQGYHTKDSTNNKAEINLSKDGGKEILTEFWPVKVGRGFTLVTVKLITGRTHQIRAHLSAVGHPILGDDKYGNREINRRLKLKYQLLHGETLVLREDKGLFSYLENFRFTAPRPEMFQEILDSI